MFSGGNVTVYVSNMDKAVRFYSETLGLKLAYRFGDHWASVEAGKGLTIGLHPASAQSPAGRSIPALAAREAVADQPEDQARRGDPLRPVPLGRPVPVPR